LRMEEDASEEDASEEADEHSRLRGGVRGGGEVRGEEKEDRRYRPAVTMCWEIGCGWRLRAAFRTRASVCAVNFQDMFCAEGGFMSGQKEPQEVYTVT